MKEHHFIVIVQKSSYPSMGALYIANALWKHGISTHIVGCEAATSDIDDLINKYDPVAVGCSVMTAPEIVDFVRHSVHIQNTYNKETTRIPVIWGGMHPTIVWEQTIKEPYIDIVVSGEAEITLPQILMNIINKNTFPDRKLVLVKTPVCLDDFRPHWEALNLSKYLFPESHSVHAAVNYKKQNIFYYLLTSRGCIYKCNFCWEVARADALKSEMKRVGQQFDFKWRSHSIKWVENQINRIEDQINKDGSSIDGVGFWDDMIFGRGKNEDMNRTKSILKILLDRNYGYLLEARANQLIRKSNTWNDAGVTREADLLRFLKETGCMQVFVGTESGNEETLRLIKKGTRLKDYARLVELSRDIGLPLRFSMIVGFPEESERSINDTLDLIEMLEEEPFVSVSGPKLFTPYPGTPQFDAAVKRGLKVPEDTLGWAFYSRYADYRSIYPWLNKNCDNKTLSRIDKFWEKIQYVREQRSKDEAILEILRKH